MSCGEYTAPQETEAPELETQSVPKTSESTESTLAAGSKDPAAKSIGKESPGLARLHDLKPGTDGAPTQQELTNAAKILRKLSEDTSNIKLYSMRRDVLERAVGVGLFFVFEAAGFEERASETGAVLQWRGPEAKECLVDSLQQVQKAADLALDPEALTFQQVSEMVSQNRSLPGILEVDDKVTKPLEPKESQITRPKKPWEKTAKAE